MIRCERTVSMSDDFCRLFGWLHYWKCKFVFFVRSFVVYFANNNAITFLISVANKNDNLVSDFFSRYSLAYTQLRESAYFYHYDNILHWSIFEMDAETIAGKAVDFYWCSRIISIADIFKCDVVRIKLQR